MSWTRDERTEINRSVRWSALGITSVIVGLVPLIVQDPDPAWLFPYPYVLFAGMLLLLVDVLLFPQHVGLRVFTNKYWTGRPYSWFWKALLFGCLGVLLVDSSWSIVDYSKAQTFRLQLLEHGEIGNGIVVATQSRSHSYFAAVAYENSGNKFEKQFQIRSKAYFSLRKGQLVRLAFPVGQPSKALLADIDEEPGMPIEIAWMILLTFGLLPAWYVVKSPFVATSQRILERILQRRGS